MNFLTINNARLEVKLIPGSDFLAPLVFLHEGLGSVSLWTQRDLDWPQAVCTATGRAGVVFSRRGYGLSESVPHWHPGPNSFKGNCQKRYLSSDYMHREAWEILPTLLQRLQIQKPVLLGHSDGATIALLHASRFAVSSCIAIAPHVFVEDIAIQAIAKAKIEFESGELRSRLSRHHADVDGAFWQWNDVWLSSDFSHFNIRADCQRISAPLLLIQGLNDEYGTLRQLNEIALVAPHAQQLRLNNCGHSPQRDQAEGTLNAVAEFLQCAE